MNVTFVILNNGNYGAMKKWAGLLGYKPGECMPGTDLPGLDFVALARGHGCPGERVTHTERLRAALESALSVQGPALVEVVVA